MEKRIEEVLEFVRPRLAMHGGNVSFVDYAADSGVVRLRMEGACKGCAMATITLKMGIEALLKSEIAEITDVQAVEV